MRISIFFLQKKHVYIHTYISIYVYMCVFFSESPMCVFSSMELPGWWNMIHWTNPSVDFFGRVQLRYATWSLGSCGDPGAPGNRKRDPQWHTSKHQKTGQSRPKNPKTLEGNWTEVNCPNKISEEMREKIKRMKVCQKKVAKPFCTWVV